MQNNASFTEWPLYIAINEFNKRLEDEVDLRPGDKIQVISDDREYNDGWYYGRNLTTGEEGLYPNSFTQELSTQRQPSLLRSRSRRIVTQPDDEGERNKIERLPSVKNTMSDIDKALEEMRRDNAPEADHSVSNVSELSHSTVLSGHNDTYVSTSHLIPMNLDPMNAKFWTPEEVTAYFISTGFDVESASRFQEHKVSGQILLELELAYLKELDIASFGTRFEMFKEIEELRKVASDVPLKPKSLPVFSTQEPHAPLQTNQTTEKSLETAPTFSSIKEEDTSQLQSEVPVVKVEKPDDQFLPVTSIRKDNSTPSPTTALHRTMLLLSDDVSHRPVSMIENLSPKPDSLYFSRSGSVKQRPMSMLLPDQELNEDDFASPRKAPKPPGYPSPVAPLPKSPSIAGSFKMSSHRAVSPKMDPSMLTKIAIPPSQGLTKPLPSMPLVTGLAEAVGPSPAKQKPSGSIQPLTKIQSESPVAVSQPSFRYPPVSSNTNSSSTSTSSRMYERHENNYTSPDLSSFRYPRRPSDSAKNSPVDSVFPSSRFSHTKTKSSGSFVDLFNRIETLGQLSLNNDSSNSDNQDAFRPPSSVYDGGLGFHSSAASAVASAKHIRHPSSSSTHRHRRHSSLLSGLIPGTIPGSPFKEVGRQRNSIVGHSRHSSLGHTRHESMEYLRHPSIVETPTKFRDNFEERRRTVSNQEKDKELSTNSKDPKRSVSEAAKNKSTRNPSNKLTKQKTSAFIEGIRAIGTEEAIRTSDFSGWMSKKGSGTIGAWKNRFFTLHGTRLSYYSGLGDNRERGLIDITAHRVLPARDDDKLVSLYAASVGKGRYCFKLVPPAPGSRKNLTFTAPKVHYFAVETQEEMRTWMAALIKATIDIDTTVPIISSCTTTTVSLSRAQELLVVAREESLLREQQRREQANVSIIHEEGASSTSSFLHGDFETMSSQHTPTTANEHQGLQSPYMISNYGAGSRDMMSHHLDPKYANRL